MFKIIWIFIIITICFCKKTENLSVQEIITYCNRSWFFTTDGIGDSIETDSIELKCYKYRRTT